MPRLPTGEIRAVADVLADEANDDRKPEEVAEAVIHALDEERGKKKRLAVVARYRWHEGDQHQLAVLGPFSTKGLSAARAVGERMAGTMQGGQGKWMAVPCYWSARDAWDAIKPASAEDQAMDQALVNIRRSIQEQQAVPMSMFDRWTQVGPTCCCGMKHDTWCHVHQRRTGDARAA